MSASVQRSMVERLFMLAASDSFNLAANFRRPELVRVCVRVRASMHECVRACVCHCVSE